MSYATNCPECHQSVTTDQHIEVNGKNYPLFRCPRCVERLGASKQFAKKMLAFVVDAEGHVRRLSEVMSSRL